MFIFKKKVGEKKFLLLTFAFSFLVFFFIRTQTPLVHDDTSAVREVAYHNAQKVEFNGHAISSLIHEFGSSSRFLSLFIRRAGATYFAKGNPPWIWYLFSSSIISLSFVSIYLLSKTVTKDRTFSVFSTLLVMFSPAQVSTSWVTFAGIQALVYLLLSFGVFAYIKFVDETTQNRRSYLFFLAGVLFVAPLVREISIVLPVFMLICQILDKKYFHPLNILLALAVLHAMYPSAIFSFYLEIPVQNIFQSHTISDALSTGARNVMFLYYFWLITPLCLIGAALLLLPLGVNYLSSSPHYKPTLSLKMLIFFLMLSLPFLRIFAMPIHLGYSLIPLSILISHVYALAWKRWNGVAFRTVLGIVLSSVSLAQVMNLYASAHTVYSINTGFSRLVTELYRNVPEKALIVSNTSALRDINQLAGRRYLFAFTNWAETYYAPLVTSPVTTEELARIVKNPPNGKPIYVLEADFPYLPHRFAFHSNRIVRNQEIELEKVGKTIVVDAHFPLIDPIKWMIPGRYHIFLGTPDYLTEIYYGRSLDGTPLMGESKVSYSIYKIVGDKVADLFYGYRLAAYKGKYYAVRNKAFSVDEQLLAEYPPPDSFEGDTITDIQRQILENLPPGVARLQMKGNLARDAKALPLHKNEVLPASYVNDGTDRPMATSDGEPIVGVTLTFGKPVPVRQINIVTFGEPQYAKDISVLAGNSQNIEDLAIIPARLVGKNEFHEKVTLPNSPFGSVVALELDTNSKYWKPWPVFGVASLTGYEKNYLKTNKDSGTFYLMEIGMYENLDRIHTYSATQ